MQRIFNINKWSLIPDGKAATFSGDRPRRVNLEVNATGLTNLYIVKDGTQTFLARVNGRDTVEFYIDGAFSVGSTGADCYIYTVDGDTFEWVDVDLTSFAVIRERPQRNYELEYIAARMAENMNRRLEAQAREIEASVERRYRAREPQPPAAVVATRTRGAGSAPGDDEPAGGDARPAAKRRAKADNGAPAPEPASDRQS